MERFSPRTQRECQSSTKELKRNIGKQYTRRNGLFKMHILRMHSNVIQTCSSVHSPQKCLTAAEHSNLNIQKPNSWTKAEKFPAISCTRKKDLFYSIKVNFIIVCIVLCINFFNSSVFYNGTLFLQPAVILSIVS